MYVFIFWKCNRVQFKHGCQSILAIPISMILLSNFISPTARTLKEHLQLWVAHAQGMPGTCSLPARVSAPTCITARASCTWRDAWRDRKLAVSFEVGGKENVPCIPGACATRKFTYLVRGPWFVFICVIFAVDSEPVATRSAAATMWTLLVCWIHDDVIKWKHFPRH